MSAYALVGNNPSAAPGTAKKFTPSALTSMTPPSAATSLAVPAGLNEKSGLKKVADEERVAEDQQVDAERIERVVRHRLVELHDQRAAAADRDDLVRAERATAAASRRRRNGSGLVNRVGSPSAVGGSLNGVRDEVVRDAGARRVAHDLIGPGSAARQAAGARRAKCTPPARSTRNCSIHESLLLRCRTVRNKTNIALAQVVERERFGDGVHAGAAGGAAELRRHAARSRAVDGAVAVGVAVASAHGAARPTPRCQARKSSPSTSPSASKSACPPGGVAMTGSRRTCA